MTTTQQRNDDQIDSKQPFRRRDSQQHPWQQQQEEEEFSQKISLPHFKRRRIRKYIHTPNINNDNSETTNTHARATSSNNDVQVSYYDVEIEPFALELIQMVDIGCTDAFVLTIGNKVQDVLTDYARDGDACPFLHALNDITTTPRISTRVVNVTVTEKRCQINPERSLLVFRGSLLLMQAQPQSQTPPEPAPEQPPVTMEPDDFLDCLNVALTSNDLLDEIQRSFPFVTGVEWEPVVLTPAPTTVTTIPTESPTAPPSTTMSSPSPPSWSPVTTTGVPTPWSGGNQPPPSPVPTTTGGMPPSSPSVAPVALRPTTVPGTTTTTGAPSEPPNVAAITAQVQQRDPSSVLRNPRGSDGIALPAIAVVAFVFAGAAFFLVLSILLWTSRTRRRVSRAVMELPSSECGQDSLVCYPHDNHNDHHHPYDEDLHPSPPPTTEQQGNTTHRQLVCDTTCEDQFEVYPLPPPTDMNQPGAAAATATSSSRWLPTWPLMLFSSASQRPQQRQRQQLPPPPLTPQRENDTTMTTTPAPSSVSPTRSTTFVATLGEQIAAIPQINQYYDDGDEDQDSQQEEEEEPQQNNWQRQSEEQEILHDGMYERHVLGAQSLVSGRWLVDDFNRLAEEEEGK